MNAITALLVLGVIYTKMPNIRSERQKFLNMLEINDNSDNESDNLNKKMISLINNFRSQNEMEPLEINNAIDKTAALQAKYMCKNKRLTHSSPGGNLKERLEANNFKAVNFGENIAKQENNDYEEVARLWMQSKEHRKNILGDFSYTGISTCQDSDGSRYWVQIFGKNIPNSKLPDVDDIETLDNYLKQGYDSIDNDKYIVLLKSKNNLKKCEKLKAENSKSEEYLLDCIKPQLTEDNDKEYIPPKSFKKFQTIPAKNRLFSMNSTTPSSIISQTEPGKTTTVVSTMVSTVTIYKTLVNEITKTIDTKPILSTSYMPIVDNSITTSSATVSEFLEDTPKTSTYENYKSTPPHHISHSTKPLGLDENELIKKYLDDLKSLIGKIEDSSNGQPRGNFLSIKPSKICNCDKKDNNYNLDVCCNHPNNRNNKNNNKDNAKHTNNFTVYNDYDKPNKKNNNEQNSTKDDNTDMNALSSNEENGKNIFDANSPTEKYIIDHFGCLLSGTCNNKIKGDKNQHKNNNELQKSEVVGMIKDLLSDNEFKINILNEPENTHKSSKIEIANPLLDRHM